MSPKRVIHANDKTVEKYLNEGVQLLRLMEKPNYTTVCADILTRYGVAIPYHTLRNCFLGITHPYRQAHASQQLIAPEAECVLVDWILFTRTHPTHSVDGQFARRPSAFAVKGQAQDGFALFLHNGPRLNLENLLGWTLL